jgi:hypothetical protein
MTEPTSWTENSDKIAELVKANAEVAALNTEAHDRIAALETQCRELREALERILDTFDDGSWNAAVSLKIKVARAVLAKYPKP